MARGVLAKDTHGSTIRLAPPIVVSEEDLRWAVDQLADVLTEFAGRAVPAEVRHLVLAGHAGRAVPDDSGHLPEGEGGDRVLEPRALGDPPSERRLRGSLAERGEQAADQRGDAELGEHVGQAQRTAERVADRRADDLVDRPVRALAT